MFAVNIFLLEKFAFCCSQVKIFSFFVFFNLSRNAGVRIGHHLENIIPTLIGFCHEEDASGEDKEVCLQVTQILSDRETSQII